MQPHTARRLANGASELPRRHFFLMIAGVLLRPATGRAQRDMLVRSIRPEDLEMPLSGFVDYITPIERFFVRTHVPAPHVDLNDWRLKVEHDSRTGPGPNWQYATDRSGMEPLGLWLERHTARKSRWRRGVVRRRTARAAWPCQRTAHCLQDCVRCVP